MNFSLSATGRGIQHAGLEFIKGKVADSWTVTATITGRLGASPREHAPWTEGARQGVADALLYEVLNDFSADPPGYARVHCTRGLEALHQHCAAKGTRITARHVKLLGKASEMAGADAANFPGEVMACLGGASDVPERWVREALAVAERQAQRASPSTLKGLKTPPRRPTPRAGGAAGSGSPQHGLHIDRKHGVTGPAPSGRTVRVPARGAVAALGTPPPKVPGSSGTLRPVRLVKVPARDSAQQERLAQRRGERRAEAAAARSPAAPQMPPGSAPKDPQ